MRSEQTRQNLFDIPNAEGCLCEVVGFSRIHSTLTIRVLNSTRTTEIATLLFGHVRYYAGPLAWKSADFHFASEEEYARFEAETSQELGEQDNMFLYVAKPMNDFSCRIYALYGAKEDGEGLHPAVRPDSLE